MKRMTLKTLLLGALAAATFTTVIADELTFGSMAPPIKVAKWLKGKAAPKFEKGKVYVVEFWATWCGPCKQSIPHLTEMATHEFKDKVQFIGVSVWEREKGDATAAYQKKVADFVKEMGDKMNYTVAVDGLDDYMSNAWMKAAGQNGIPTAFIVNQEGKVAWIGHPMVGLDEALRSVIAGTYNIEEAVNRRKAEEAAQLEMMSASRQIQSTIDAGDFKKAIELIDAVLKKANLPAEALPAQRAFMYNNVAWEALTGKNADKADLKWTLKIAVQAMDESKNDPTIMDTAALAYFKNGDKERAIAIQTEAVAKIKTVQGIDPAMVKEMEERLAKYKSGS